MKANPFGPWTTALSPLSGAKLSTHWVRRLKGLSRLGKSSIRLSRRSLLGLMAMSTTALLMPSLRGTPLAKALESGGPVPSNTEATDDQASKKDRGYRELLLMYRLEPKQNLKLVPLPRPEGMRDWLNRELAGSGDQMDRIISMTFHWKEPDQLQRWSTLIGFGKGASLVGLPASLDMKIDHQDIEGDAELLKTPISGDWVFRKGVPVAEMLQPLEAIVQETLKQPITFRLREVERDVVVARGQYLSTPLKGRSKNNVQIYGTEIIDGKDGGGGSGTFAEFLKHLGAWIERPIVSEVENPPKDEIDWRYNMRSPFTQAILQEAHDEANVLQHVQEQTGLTFTRERKKIPILFIELKE